MKFGELGRREFITLLGGAAATWPLAVRAQQARKAHTIGYLSPAVPVVFTPVSAAFTNALRELGWVEGQNITIERRYAENRLERLPELAAELVRLNVELIVAIGTLGPLAAKRATSTIPIVMTAAGDPLASGLVSSLAHPGGNVTGLSLMVPDIAGKRLQLLKQILPQLARVSDAIKSGRLVAHKWGRRTVILSDDLHRFLTALPRLGEEGARNEGV